MDLRFLLVGEAPENNPSVEEEEENREERFLSFFSSASSAVVEFKQRELKRRLREPPV